jgi:uncharacterized protein (TIGR02588 family)
MPSRRPRKIPPIEWIAGGISALIVLGTIVYLGFEAVQVTSDGPMLSAQVREVRAIGPAFVVDVDVRNQSRAAAAEVQVAGEVRSPDGTKREGRATVDFVPGLSTRQVSLVFDFDPGRNPEVRIVGYVTP